MSTLTIDRPTQRREALVKANETRIRRAELKRAVRAGHQPVAPLIIDPPDCLATATLFELLVAVPRWGRVKVNRILNRERISPHKTIGGLSQRQRQALVSVLSGERAARTGRG